MTFPPVFFIIYTERREIPRKEKKMKTKTILIIIVGIMRVLRIIYKVRRNAKRFNNLE